MTTLTIDRLSADVPEAAGSDTAVRVDQLLHDLADHRLADRVGVLTVGDGDWCLRRLDVAVPFDPSRPDPAIADRWAEQVLAALADALADGTSALHYRHRGAALTEIVCRLAAGRTGPVWAWRQLGLLQPTDPDPAVRPGPAALTALQRSPREALAAVLRAADTVGVDALHRLFGQTGWTTLARLVQPAWSASGGTPREQRPGAGAALGQTSPASGPDPRLTGPERPGTPSARPYRQDSRFCAACQRSSIRPDPAVATAWAVIALTEVEPTGRVWSSPAVLDRLAATFADPAPIPRRRSATAEPELPAGGPDRHTRRPRHAGYNSNAPAETPPQPATAPQPGTAPQPRTEGPVRKGPVGTDASARTVPPAVAPQGAADQPVPESTPHDRSRPQHDEPTGVEASSASGTELEPASYATAWAGLPYLLNTAEMAGIPDRLRDDPRLATRTFRWILHQTALRLVPIRADDPAALLMAGLTPEADLPSGPDADPVEDTSLAEHARYWADHTLRRLAEAAPEPDTADRSLWWLARRPGCVVADPGWLQVRLGLDQVELDIRRAGLDLDPGWLEWLGAVVRFRYA